MSSEFETGFDLYIRCIDRINQKTEKELDDKLWLAFISSGFEGTFEDYKKQIIKKPNIEDQENRNIKEKNIINKSEELKKRMEEIDSNSSVENKEIKIHEVVIK